MLNVVSAPGETFEEVRDHPYLPWNWVAPLAVAALVGVLFAVVAFSQPAVIDDMLRQQLAGIDRQVESGKLTAEAAAAARDGMEKARPFMGVLVMVFGGVGAVIGTLAFAFAVAFGLWLVSRFALGSPVEYWKLLEVVGLTSVIHTIGTVATLFVVIYRGSITSSVSAAMLVPGLAPESPLFTLLSALNPFMIWWLMVVALGWALVVGRAWRVTLVWLVGLYGIVFLGLAGLAQLRS